LAFLETETGRKLLEDARKGKKPGAVSQKQLFEESTKTIIVPVAVPGCGTLHHSLFAQFLNAGSHSGKTTVSVALAHIFGFGHTQSDDVKQKKAAPVFIKNVTQLLKAHKIVIADKYVLRFLFPRHIPNIL
jgi:tRNA ligase